ncbi:hypothetical protein ACIQC9_08350 [Brevundimonas sp. NPDC092305]|uniref:hypothetical protein n=1 Tax=Brevundimonas sp. NPDC092305 TaxID=3363957 RepID=UPI003803B514
MALIGVDEAACLRKLAELEALIRERQPGSGGGGGGLGGGDARGPSPAASAAAPSGGSQASPAPRAPLPAITPPTPFSQNMPSHLEFMPPVRRLEMEAMAEMVEAVRESGLAAVRVAAEADAAAPPALDGSLPNKAGEIAQSANETIATAEAFQQVLINEPGDVISAAMEDAFRVFDEANQAYDQIVQRAMDREMTDAELAAYTEQVKSALRRLEAARKGIQAVRMRQLKWLLEEKDGGVRAGFAAAFDQMEARHRYELRIVDERCEAIGQEAHVRVARDHLNGVRNSAAMREAEAQCDAITKPVRDRHNVEEQNLFDQYRVTAEDVEAELRRSAQQSAGPGRAGAAAGGRTGAGGRGGAASGGGGGGAASGGGSAAATADQSADAQAAWNAQVASAIDDLENSVEILRARQGEGAAGSDNPGIYRVIYNARDVVQQNIGELHERLEAERGATVADQDWLAGAINKSARILASYEEINALVEARESDDTDPTLGARLSASHADNDRLVDDFMTHLANRPAAPGRTAPNPPSPSPPPAAQTGPR